MRPPAVAVFSPSSSPVPFRRRRSRALAELERRFDVVHLGAGWSRDVEGQAGTAEQRAAELIDLAMLPQSPMLMASTGGFLCNQILPHLQFGLLNEIRPTVCGFSDVSTLLLALYAKTGVRCLHGPAVLPSYGESGGVDPYTHECLLNVAGSLETPIPLKPPSFVATHFAKWDTEDDRPEARNPSGGWKPINPGVAEGPVVAANLEVLEGMLATPYLPAFDGCILILEEAGGPVDRTVRRLEHLHQAGVLARLAGLVLGRLPDGSDPQDRRYEVLHQIGRCYKIPVLADLDVGHTDPKVTIPLGSIVRLDIDRGEFILNTDPSS